MTVSQEIKSLSQFMRVVYGAKATANYFAPNSLPLGRRVAASRFLGFGLFDHSNYWIKDKKPFAITSEPYSPGISVKALTEILQLPEFLGVSVCIGPKSFHHSGTRLLIWLPESENVTLLPFSNDGAITINEAVEYCPLVYR